MPRMGELTLERELATCLPTPLRHLASYRGELWVKDDGQTGLSYGGNKLRKLGPLLRDALERGARRVVTLGAAGSHHVLSTTIYAGFAGLQTAAFLTPQPDSKHVRATLRAALGQGLEPLPLVTGATFARSLISLRATDYWIGPGAMGATGAAGYASAAQELLRQLAGRALPPPDWIVVACGSGSTAAGLLVGLAEAQCKTRLLAVSVASNPAIRPIIELQARSLGHQRGLALSRQELRDRLHFCRDFVGRGYGYASPAARKAGQEAARCGLQLDSTYTEKAFAAALELARAGEATVYWHTLSGLPLEPLLADAPTVELMAPALRRLLI